MSERLIFSGGCFWCIEHKFQEISGVISAIPGFTPSDLVPVPQDSFAMVRYRQSGDYRESVEVIYDTDKIDLQLLVGQFLQMIDPYDLEGSFNNRGFKYTPMIVINDNQQKYLIQEIFDEKNIIIPILEDIPFYAVSEEHRNYAKKFPKEYQEYLRTSGRTK